MQKVTLVVATERLGQLSTFAPLDTSAQLSGVRLNNDGAAIFVSPVFDAGGFADTPLMLADNADNVAPIDQNRYLGTVSRLTGYDFEGNVWNRLLALNDNVNTSQAVDAAALLGTVSRGQVFDGVGGYARQREGNAINLGLTDSRGATMTTRVGEWTVTAAPAANTIATATRAAGGVGTRHIITGFLVSNGGNASAGRLVTINSGGILWQLYMETTAAAPSPYGQTGLHIVCPLNTAVTIAWDLAPGAGAFQSVSMSGFTSLTP